MRPSSQELLSLTAAETATLVMPSLRAFIVEDSPVILENLVGALAEMANVSVVGSVADEAAAISWLTRHGHGGADIFIIDVFLRSGTGLAVLQAAQALGVSARRVVLTNYATEDIRRRCSSLGAERVFDKSRELDELISYCATLSGSASRPMPL